MSSNWLKKLAFRALGKKTQSPASPLEETTQWLTTFGAGTRVAHYEVIEPLGQGGMGLVCKARDLHLDRVVALKILDIFRRDPLPPSRARELRRRFEKEARLAARIRHPNIVQIYDADLSMETPFFVMELIDGEDLRTRMRRRPALSLTEALDVVAAVATALDYAYREHRIIHRDLKPANIMLAAEGTVKLVDLGVAKALTEVDPEGSITHTGEAVGTPYYVAPEQALGKKNVDVRADIYALGLVLYELAAGRKALAGDTVQEVLRAKMHGAVAPIAEVRADLPPALAAMIMRMIATAPADRPSDYREVLMALAAARAAMSGAASAAAAPTPSRRLVDAQAVIAAITPGTVLGGYSVGDLIGVGGMGAVFRAQSPRFGKVALKVLVTPDDGRGKTAMQQVRHEAEVVRCLDHPAIVKVREIGEDSGMHFLVMDLFLGPYHTPLNLGGYAQMFGNVLDVETVKTIFGRLAAAVAHAHAQGVLHGDLKPANILFSYADTETVGDRELWKVWLKLTDFGLARFVGEERVLQSVRQSLSRQASGAGLTDDARALIGTFDYMSPEQKRGAAATTQSDVYAMGKILFRLLTGQQNPGLQRPSELVPGLHRDWDDIVVKALAEVPERRFPSASAFAEAIHAAP